MELIIWLPEVALGPDQAPLALQLEALLEDQLSVDEPPLATMVGAAPNETVGAGDDVLFPPVYAVGLLPQAARPSAHASTDSEP